MTILVIDIIQAIYYVKMPSICLLQPSKSEKISYFEAFLAVG